MLWVRVPSPALLGIFMPLSNFGFVSTIPGKGSLYRSAQPDEWDFLTLKNLGILTTFRLNPDSLDPATEVKDFVGGEVVYFPLPTFTVSKEQTIEAVTKLKALLDAGKNVLVHCTHGRDRTGLIVGAYRLLYDGWALEQIEVERALYGVNCFVFIADFEIQRFLKEISVDINKVKGL